MDFEGKNNVNCEIKRYKARLIAKGYNQKHDVTCDEVITPVTRFEII